MAAGFGVWAKFAAKQGQASDARPQKKVRNLPSKVGDRAPERVHRRPSSISRLSIALVDWSYDRPQRRTVTAFYRFSSLTALQYGRVSQSQLSRRRRALQVPMPIPQRQLQGCSSRCAAAFACSGGPWRHHWRPAAAERASLEFRGVHDG